MNCHEEITENTEYSPSIDPDFKQFISPGEARRMSRILKRAFCTSLHVIRESRISMPDAIITGTGAGCMENSEKFLSDMALYGENFLKPTQFMQSTHNTIGSQIAISLKCHGYNNTYSHLGISFESALLDAWLQIKSGTAENVLVGAHDEVTPLMAKIMKRSHPEFNNISETSMSCMLSRNPFTHNEIKNNDGNTKSNNFDVCDSQKKLCEVCDIRIIHSPAVRSESKDDIMQYHEIAEYLTQYADPVIMAGINGNKLNDAPYRRLFDSLNYNPTLITYRDIFGDNHSSSAMAFYSAVRLIEEGKITDDKITVINHSDSKHWGIIRIKAGCL